jgi:hypothetical protein
MLPYQKPLIGVEKTQKKNFDPHEEQKNLQTKL